MLKAKQRIKVIQMLILKKGKELAKSMDSALREINSHAEKRRGGKNSKVK